MRLKRKKRISFGVQQTVNAAKTIRRVLKVLRRASIRDSPCPSGAVAEPLLVVADLVEACLGITCPAPCFKTTVMWM